MPRWNVILALRFRWHSNCHPRSDQERVNVVFERNLIPAQFSNFFFYLFVCVPFLKNSSAFLFLEQQYMPVWTTNPVYDHLYEKFWILCRFTSDFLSRDMEKQSSLSQKFSYKLPNVKGI